MKLTTEEKLEKAIEFIKSIECIDKSKYNRFSLSELEKGARGECIDCCQPDDDYCYDLPVKLCWPYGMSGATQVIDEQILDDISNNAWHILADLSD